MRLFFDSVQRPTATDSPLKLTSVSIVSNACGGRLLSVGSHCTAPATLNVNAAAVDAENRLLWRKSPQRLDGEAVRDGMLLIAGVLNPQRGGPAFEDVKIVPNDGTTYYEPFDQDSPALNRRTVYRFSPRGGRVALLDVFDCPDPSTATPRRSVTTTPLQALSLLNNAFVLRMADHCASRIKRDVGDQELEKQVQRSFQLALCRLPTPEEQQAAQRLVNQHGLQALVRGLFNTNEFLIVQ